MSCTCRTAEFNGKSYPIEMDGECPLHGLPPGMSWLPMAPYQREGESAGEAQRRLYEEAGRIVPPKRVRRRK